MKRTLLIAIALLSIGVVVPVTATAQKPKAQVTGSPGAGEVARKMQQFYEKTRDLQAKFKQVHMDTLYGHTRTHFGYVYAKKPGMMRWNYVKPPMESLITNGKTLWVLDPEDKQARSLPLGKNALAGLSFLLGEGDLEGEFTIGDVIDPKERVGAASDLVLKLTPRKPTAQYRYLVVAVRPRDFCVGEALVVHRESRTRFTFSGIKTDAGIPDSRFKVPAGTRIEPAAPAPRSRPSSPN